MSTASDFVSRAFSRIAVFLPVDRVDEPVRAPFGLLGLGTHPLQLLVEVLGVLHPADLLRRVLRRLREAEHLTELLVQRGQFGHQALLLSSWKRGRMSCAHVVEERVLVGADLLHVELVDAGVGELLQPLVVALEVRAERHGVHRLLGHELRRLLEVRRRWAGPAPARPAAPALGHSRCAVLRACASSGPKHTFAPAWTGPLPPSER